MTVPVPRSRKVPYDLRPAKQINRRMMIDALQILSIGGFPIRQYQYTGFGSIFFVDFILLHRILGIQRMLSVEHDPEARQRVKFNKPFDNIQLGFGPINQFIPQLDDNIKHLLWLDYDYPLDRDVIADVSSAASKVAPSSIVIVTVNVNPRGEHDRDAKSRFQYYQDHARQYFDAGWSEHDFGKKKLVMINVTLLLKAIKDGVSARKDLEFLPIFNFVYADTTMMITFGGMIGGRSEKRKLGRCDFSNAPYLRRNTNADPYHIHVPILTRKERLYLDGEMPAEHGWKPKSIKLDDEDLTAYREIYRYFPSYAELLLG